MVRPGPSGSDGTSITGRMPTAKPLGVTGQPIWAWKGVSGEVPTQHSFRVRRDPGTIGRDGRADHIYGYATRTNPLVRGTLRVYPRDGFSSAPQFIWGIIGLGYAALRPSNVLFQTPLKRTNGETAIQSPYIRLRGARPPQTPAASLLVSLSKMPRPASILPVPDATRSGPGISDQG